MITADLTGNISNHMFQYAITRTVAEYNHFDYGFNPVVSNDYFGGREQMSMFEMDYGIRHNAGWKEIPEGIDTIWEEPGYNFYHQDSVNFYPYCKDIFNIKDRTKLVISSCQNALYYNKDSVRSWFKIKDENIEKCKQILKSNNIFLDENLCVINSRGGEYLGVSTLFLVKDYWINAINSMRSINPNMRFLVVTDDPEFFKSYFNFPVFHGGICCDYYILNNCVNSIISNSSFGLFNTWLNTSIKNVIYPKWWARHNVSNGYWACSNVWTFAKDDNWLCLDRNGKLYDYQDVSGEGGGGIL